MHNFNWAKEFSLERIPAYTTGKSFLKLLVVITEVHTTTMGGDELYQALLGLPAPRIAIAVMPRFDYDWQLLIVKQEVKQNRTTLVNDRERRAGISGSGSSSEKWGIAANTEDDPVEVNKLMLDLISEETIPAAYLFFQNFTTHNVNQICSCLKTVQMWSSLGITTSSKQA